MMVFIGVVLVLSGALFWFFSSKNKKNLVPMAPTTFLECAREFGGPDGPMWLHHLATTMGRNTFRVPMPLSMTGAYVVGDGALAREIYNDNLTDKPWWLMSVLTNLTGGKGTAGIRTHHDPYVRHMRKGMAPAFSKREVDRMNRIASRLGDDFLGRLKELSNQGKSFDPSMECNRVVFMAILEAGFEYIPTEEEYQGVYHHLTIACNEFFLRQISSPWRALLGKIHPEVRQAHESASFMRDFARKVLYSYRKNPRKSEEKTIIRLFEEIMPEGDDEQIIAEIVGWILAGHETTGFSISNTMVLLAKHPDKQEKLRRELQGSDSAPYLQYVIKETTRIVPVVAIASMRLTGRDFQCNDGSIIPEGAVCIMTYYGANRDEAVYKDPETFHPERWEHASKEMIRNRYPFALGSRDCLGQRLALSNMDNIIPKLMSSFNFEVVEPGKLSNILTFKYVGAQLKAKQL
ncbi:Leukotriene-B(4) omega-hydroxylase 2 [Seminavis robusta]|uniref:Leukotriene-B(4) omega-hydroxylase 2 n=1 Tax=Seminavis robusta TaxID=568900 RepID=A0A9N8DRU2_9STRA|nr:Leukotriene-B(4) omega-hydroxylase 2 [Seminavis robusta]|eukprot:Sro235_g094690.1 Leukotriene-B(4) omega-hydroxylase 2 (462) ;mRNA; f:36326-37711